MIEKDIDEACRAFVGGQSAAMRKDLDDICMVMHFDDETTRIARESYVKLQTTAFMIGACWADRLWRTGTEEELTALKRRVDEYIQTMIETNGIVQ